MVGRENQEVDMNEDVFRPGEMLEVQFIDIPGHDAYVDRMFDGILAISQTILDQSLFDSIFNITTQSYMQYLGDNLAANKRGPKENIVVVKGQRRGGLGGLLPPLMFSGGGGFVPAFDPRPLLSDEQEANIRANLKAMFPGTTDAEIDTLVDQLARAGIPLRTWLALSTIRSEVIQGRTFAYMSRAQFNQMASILRSIGTPEALRALQRLNQGQQNGSIIVTRF